MQTFSTLVDDIAEVTCRKGEEQLISGKRCGPRAGKHGTVRAGPC